MSNADALGRRAVILAALGDRTRLALLLALVSGGAQPIVALAADTGLTRQGVTKHLQVLQRAGLVSSIRSGRESRFAAEPAPLAETGEFLRQVADQWDNALGRLQRHLEG
ncbi:helix-turn-helix transcriptional regulator [Roseomonas sp. AR75]|uniref:ArsR/SmtB family transcription factor n=1 Tax=Roseomonas sp. AR75 TaxID=2562311 RepID=UPI0010C08E67|nr:helix-turn-helix transcriptional regulator [Roseomonas sp. AR75]